MHGSRGSPHCRKDMEDEGKLSYTRLHMFAYKVFTRDQLTESWYREGLKIIDDWIERDSRLPKPMFSRSSGVRSSGASSSGADLGAAVGGVHTAASWKQNPLGIPPGRFTASGASQRREGEGRQKSPSPDPTRPPPFAMERLRKEYDQAAAEARSEAFSLNEARLQADKTFRKK